MTVAGLDNVSTFGPLFKEAESRVSRRWNDQIIRPGTQASSLLQMWREIEGEHVVSHSLKSRPRKSNGSDSDCLSTTTSIGQGHDSGNDISKDADEYQNRAITGSEMEHEDHISVVSEQSSDLGDTAREKVRLIFRSWMNSSAKSHSPNILHRKNSGPQYLGENECRRVRIIREWVQTNVEPSSCGSPRDGSSEVGSQIEQVREGLVINPEIGSTHRSIRRLCGRQTLIDLLLRARSERERELLRMLEQKSVSGFAHRKRIQALLRGRFLQNKRLIPNEKPSGSVATELGLLRQSTVSDLREGFLSKLDNSAHPSANGVATDHTLADKSNSQSESVCEDGEVTEIFPASHQESALDSNQSHWDSEVQISEVDLPVLTSRRSIREASIARADSQQDRVLECERAIGSDIECVHIRYDKSNRITGSEGWSLENEDINQSECPEVFREDELRSGRSEIYESINYTANLGQNNGSEEIDSQDASSLQEVVHEYDVTSFLEDSADPWFRQTPHNDVVEQEQMQESRENRVGHDLQDGADISFDMPFNEIRASIEGIYAFYFHEDDNVHRKELRELFSRRRVSGLLGSSFRESLNRVLQSHAQRLSHASNDWELGNSSSPSVLIEREPTQQIGDQNSNNDLHIGNWTHGSNQSLGTDNWEVENELRNDMANSDVVNELRNDIAMLQQRMNNMQSMLEACMDMQIEMQCFLRQDVSSISNRSFVSTVLPSNADSTEYDLFNEESPWNIIKRGICCLCCVTKISSLLYRCGHMCLCSRCAESLVQKMGKCPICQALVVETVQAYFILQNQTRGNRRRHGGCCAIFHLFNNLHQVQNTTPQQMYSTDAQVP